MHGTLGGKVSGPLLWATTSFQPTALSHKKFPVDCAEPQKVSKFGHAASPPVRRSRAFDFPPTQGLGATPLPPVRRSRALDFPPTQGRLAPPCPPVRRSRALDFPRQRRIGPTFVKFAMASHGDPSVLTDLTSKLSGGVRPHVETSGVGSDLTSKLPGGSATSRRNFRGWSSPRHVETSRSPLKHVETFNPLLCYVESSKKNNKRQP